MEQLEKQRLDAHGAAGKTICVWTISRILAVYRYDQVKKGLNFRRAAAPLHRFEMAIFTRFWPEYC